MSDTTEAEVLQDQQQLAIAPRQPEQKPLTTSTQARIEAVAELTKTALAKAGTLQLTPEESKALLADFGDSDFQPGAGGKENLLYIEHAALRDRFNSVLGLGQWAIIVRETWNEDFTSPKGTKGVRVYARAMLLVRGCYVGEAVGDMDYFPNNASQNYGDAFEGAKTAAFRRCAKEFGVGLQAWRKGFSDGWRDRKYAKMEQEQAAKYPPRPTAPKPDANGDKPLKERLNSMALWLHGQLGVEDAKMVIPYLNSHKADGSEGAALLPTEQLDALSESAFAVIKSDPHRFVARVKAWAKENDQIPGAEAPAKEKQPLEVTGIIAAVEVKEGVTDKWKWKLFSIKIGEQIYTTFSKTVGEAAKGVIGEEVKLTYETNDKGNTATSLTYNGTTVKAGESKR